MEERNYASILEGRFPVPFELPTGERIETFSMRRLTAKERRELAKSAKDDLELIQRKIRLQLVTLGSLSAPFEPKLLDELDTLNEDMLIEAQAAIDRGYPSVEAFREAVERGQEKTFR